MHKCTPLPMPVSPLPSRPAHVRRARVLNTHPQQVSEEFSDFVVDNVLTARQLWDELLSGTRCSAFWRLVSLRVDAALGVAPEAGLPNIAGQGLYNLLGEDDWQWLRAEAVKRMRAALPTAVPAVYTLTDESLGLKVCS